MTTYRKKPVVIEAEVYRSGLEDGVEGSIEFKFGLIPFHFKLERASKPYINTLEGKHYITPGDYIITGVKGERYPCKPDIFTATYEPASDFKTAMDKAWTELKRTMSGCAIKNQHAYHVTCPNCTPTFSALNSLQKYMEESPNAQ